MRAIALKLIRGYQIVISPLFPPSCRYLPTCSEYGYEAIEKYGIIKGGWMAIRRILRCHPFRPGGYDPVP
jgi:uncharacterized protein